MCGRTFCALDPTCIQKLCRYKVDGHDVTPEWKDAPTADSYRPSYNIGPTIFTPVLLSTLHYSKGEECPSRVLQPMRWGLIPSWHKGDRSSFKTMHNNCRGETLFEKATFSTPMKKGRRCVVIAEGFYEWKTTDKKKMPYAFVKRERFEVKPEIDAKPSVGTRSLSDPAASSDLLLMAGIFDVCKESAGDLYSYCVVTTESVGSVADIHHRMPVILESDEDVERWLNFEEFPSTKVKDLVRGRDCLSSYPVMSKVNNVRYQESDCCQPAKSDTSGATISKGDIRNWFTQAPVRKRNANSVKKEPSTDDVSPEKKFKIKEESKP